MNAKRLNNLVDELGVLRAQLAALKDDEAALRQELLESGVTEAEGNLFRAVVVESDRKTIDWQKIAKLLKPSRQLIAGNTRRSTSTSIRINARRGVAA